MNELSARDLVPVLRWAGGKRWLAPAIRQAALQVEAQHYVEPFLGGAAAFLATDWRTSKLGDVNPLLIRCYRGIAEDPGSVRQKLRRLAVNLKTYEAVKSWKPSSDTGAAARLLYLNRTAYAGIYRENRKGEYNVPFSGDRGLDSLLASGRLEALADAFRRASLVSGDFSQTLFGVRKGAFIYCDPPYSLNGAEDAFRRYHQVPFSWTDQIRLAQALRRVVSRGCTVLLSNSAHEDVQDLYKQAIFLPVSRRPSMSRLRTEDTKEAVYVMHADERVAESIAQVVAVSASGQ